MSKRTILVLSKRQNVLVVVVGQTVEADVSATQRQVRVSPLTGAVLLEREQTADRRRVASMTPFDEGHKRKRHVSDCQIHVSWKTTDFQFLRFRR